MKNLLLTLIMINVLLVETKAQILSMTLSMSSHPSAILSEWTNDKTLMTYVVTTQKALQYAVVIKTEIKLADGTPVATTDLSKASLINLGQGTFVYNANEVMPLETMVFSGSYKSSMIKTGMLPSGSYQIFVQLVMAGTYSQVFEAQTKYFNLMAFQLPVLIKPAQNDTLKMKEAQTAILFRWTPLSPVTKTLPVYHLQVFEIMENQKPVQALRANQPLLDITLTGQTQYIWKPQIPFIEDSIVKNFIWTIQTLDPSGKPLIQTDGNGESRSEPMFFYVRTH